MLFSKKQAINAAKLALSPADKKRTSELELALMVCLDDLSTRMKSVADVKKDEVAVTANDREKKLSGSQDLKSVWFLKYGTGDDQKVLEYVSPRVFLKEYDNPSAVVGTPSYYTILETEDGFPVVKWDCPVESATTLIVYYFADITSQSFDQFRSIAAIAMGLLAYFYGLDDPRGDKYYANYRELVALKRAADDFKGRSDRKFTMSDTDKTIMGQVNILSGRRY